MDSLLTVDSLQVQFNTKKELIQRLTASAFRLEKARYWESWENRAAVRA